MYKYYYYYYILILQNQLIRCLISIVEVCFTIKTVTKAWGSENSWTFGKCKSTERYSSRRTYTSSCCLNQGEHTLTCKDHYGDGWHGGYLEIQGKKYCKNFRTGRERKTTITINGMS